MRGGEGGTLRGGGRRDREGGGRRWVAEEEGKGETLGEKEGGTLRGKGERGKLREEGR